MDSNTHSIQPSEPPEPPERPDRLAALTAAVEELAAHDLARLSDVALAEQVLELRRRLDRLEGRWLHQLAAIDARGAAGADQDQQPGSTAAWLRNRLRMGAGAATGSVRTARALFRGPLPQTAQALTSGVISPAHARVIAQGIHDLPDHLAAEADPVLVAAAGRLDPPRLRLAVGHLRQVADPDGADRDREHRHQRRGVWLAATWEGMVAVNGLLEPEAGHTVLAALEPLARPANAEDTRSGGQRTADALAELARRSLEAGRLPQAGGVRPQLAVTVDLDTLLGHPGTVGADLGWAGPLDPEACRRLACDSTVTRVLVTRHPTSHRHLSDQPHPNLGPATDLGPAADHDLSDHAWNAEHGSSTDRGPSRPVGLQGRLQTAMAVLPPTLGGAPSQPLDLGRATRVVQPAQRMALAVRDGGCVFPDCTRPLAWCEAHHRLHWLDGGPTDLANLALVCRAHHRAVHEGGWRLARGPDGRFTATPPHRGHQAAA